MKKAMSLVCAVLLLTGCWEARFHSGRIVALNFPRPEGQAQVSLSVNDVQIQEAFKLINSALTSDGYVLDPSRPGGEERELVARYKKPVTTGNRQFGTPHVFLRNDRIEVTVIELGNRSGKLTPETKRICRLLEKELGGRYGSERVRIVTPD